jgi:hypothetical protein
MLGAEAFAFLLDAIRECAIAGKSHSTKPSETAVFSMRCRGCRGRGRGRPRAGRGSR